MSFTAPHVPPRCEVHWAGFMSDTYTLQSCGWEAAIESAHNQSMNYGSLALILRHRATGWSMYAECDEPYGSLLERARSHHYAATRERPPRFEVRHCRPDDKMVLLRGGGSSEWGRVNLHPEVDFEHVPVSKLNIFAPLRPETREFVVAPDKVADLMERIRKLQEPELAEIRERNRQRDARERPAELHHATILSIAA